MDDYTTDWPIFIQLTPKPRTEVWQVEQDMTGNVIGIIKWHSPWRRYNFFPHKDMLCMDAICMEELALHCRMLMRERAERLVREKEEKERVVLRGIPGPNMMRWSWPFEP